MRTGLSEISSKPSAQILTWSSGPSTYCETSCGRDMESGDDVCWAVRTEHASARRTRQNLVRMPHIPSCSHEQSFRADAVAINLQQDGTLQKADGQYQAEALLEARNDSFNARQSTFSNPNPLSRLEKWKRLDWKLKAKSSLQ